MHTVSLAVGPGYCLGVEKTRWPVREPVLEPGRLAAGRTEQSSGHCSTRRLTVRPGRGLIPGHAVSTESMLPSAPTSSVLPALTFQGP